MSQHQAERDIAVPNINASTARKLVDRSISTSKEHSDQYSEHRQELALRHLALVLQEIEKKASHGKTQMEWTIRDRAIPQEHRDEVIQILKSHLDHRGFNVLSYWVKSILGGQTIFQIEW